MILSECQSRLLIKKEIIEFEPWILMYLGAKHLPFELFLQFASNKYNSPLVACLFNIEQLWDLDYYLLYGQGTWGPD